MKLSLEQMRSITQGIQSAEYVDGMCLFSRFTKDEADCIGSFNVRYPAGVQLKFKTDGEILRMRVYAQGSDIRQYFSFDIFENDKLIGCIKNIEESEAVGNYASKKYKSGDFEGEFKLGKGEKNLRIVLPHSAFAGIYEIELENATFVIPVKPHKTLVAYGDSITQGYDSVHPSNTYAMRLAEYLGAELYNKGIGGAQFIPRLAGLADGLTPDLVTVAYGTNDWNCVTKDVFRANAEGFFENIVNKYPDTPIIAFSPIWRKDFDREMPFGKFNEVEEVIKEVCGKFESVKFVSGIDLVEHREDLFGDLNLHPNDKGFEYYFKNIIKNL